MKVLMEGLGPNNVYVELTRENNNDGTGWIRVKLGYEGNPATFNSGIGLAEARALARALQGLT